jgi:PPOX class probable F420-dependent enzyme
MSTYPESHADLLAAPGVAVVSTLTPKGAIQSTAVWFLVEDDTLKFSFSDARAKLKNLQKNPTVNVYFLDPANPFRFLEVRGTVSIEPDPDKAFAQKVGAKYGADIRNFDQPGDTRFVVTVNAAKVNASA